MKKLLSLCLISMLAPCIALAQGGDVQEYIYKGASSGMTDSIAYIKYTERGANMICSGVLIAPVGYQASPC